MNEQIQALEERMAWYERKLHELDAVVRELADEVVRLRRELEGPLRDRRGGRARRGAEGRGAWHRTR